MSKMAESFSINELENQKRGLEDRIKRLEQDLKIPLEADLEEQAAQLSNQNILRRLLEVERENLRKLNRELDNKR